MSLIQKYIWLVKTIHRAGRITLKELNEKWRDNTDLSRGESLPRQTFDRWKGGVLDLFGIIIDCEQRGGYHYYIANPKVLESGELKAWLLDTYGTAATLSGCLSIHDRILTEDIPSVDDTRRDEDERCFADYLSFFHDERIGDVSCRALLRENVCSAMVYAGKKYRL